MWIKIQIPYEFDFIVTNQYFIFFKKRIGVAQKKWTKINVHFFILRRKIIFEKTRFLILKHNAAKVNFYCFC